MLFCQCYFCIIDKMTLISPVISIYWQSICPFLCNSSEITEHKYRSVRKIQCFTKFRRHLEAFASELSTNSNTNKGDFSFRKAYCVITIIIQLIGNTLQ